MNKQIFLMMLATGLVALPMQVLGQSLTTGDIAGTITDPSGAVVSGAAVTLKSLDTGSTQATKTGGAGEYRFRLLKPGHYSVTAGLTGFQNSVQNVEVNVGDVSTVNLQLTVGAATQTVEVVETAPLLNPEPSNNTSFTSTQVALLPSAGSDITNIAFTTPGAVVNVTGGYGNFTVNGLPATSNLFTINGENDMDPYFNINNSGASNLTLGQNEIQEATIVTNPYAGQYGQLSGAQVTYITKSGTNQFHGNMQYWWNGRFMNANDWFNNSSINGYTSRPFSNANQWASSLGGPIIKNKTFFFIDTEGLRFILPNDDSVTIPTTAFANAVLANVQVKEPAEASTYQKLFSLYANAPGASAAQPIANNSACNSIVLPGFNGATMPCAARFQATPTSLASEWILAFRIDQRIGDKDNAYFRFKQDHGLQPTTISPISPNFDANSNQPSWDAQLNETHVFGPRATNSFMATLSWYKAQFAQNEPLASNTFPYSFIAASPVPFYSDFNPLQSFPQGRNITQYQFIDDYSLIVGKHNLKFGENFRRYDVSDHNFFHTYPEVYFGYTSNGLQNFANGLAYEYRKSLNPSDDVPIGLWGIGMYAQDEWSVTPSLKITAALRIEHNSNPVCNFNCFANFNGPFSTLPSYTSANPGNVPYSSDITAGLHSAYPGTNAIDWSPRLGFSWSPFNDKKTVISGGIGIFYDNVASSLVDDLLANPPESVGIVVRPSSGTPGFDPNGAALTWAQSAAAFSLSKTYSQISSQLKALGSVFSAPAVTALVGKFKDPEVQEWNIQLQRQLSGSMVLTANYVGNHSIRIPYSNPWPNAYDEYGYYPGVAGIPANVPVPNYGTVTQVQSGALSNYNGLSVTVAKQFSKGLQAHFNYTWSHAIDEVSNGGINTYGDSLLGQINPLSLRANNYGNADYDIRNNFSADYVYTPNFHLGNKFLNEVVSGWQWSGKIFWRSGLPFSIMDGNTALGNGGGTLLATYVGGKAQTGCGEGAALTPCLNANAFLNSGAASFTNFTAFSNQNRNMFRGPHYFDVDMALFRTFHIRERLNLAVGLQAFNAFNHPNFGLPDNTLGDPTFGQILGMASTPTSPYGNFLGFDSSVRVVQLTGKIVF